MTCVKLSYWLQACRYGISLQNSSPLCRGRFSSVSAAWDGIGRKVLLHCVHAVLAKDCIEPFRIFVQIKKNLQTFFPLTKWYILSASFFSVSTLIFTSLLFTDAPPSACNENWLNAASHKE